MVTKDKIQKDKN